VISTISGGTPRRSGTFEQRAGQIVDTGGASAYHNNDLGNYLPSSLVLLNCDSSRWRPRERLCVESQWEPADVDEIDPDRYRFI
jgi:hypothetical protein